jgi:hypothetical protein
MKSLGHPKRRAAAAGQGSRLREERKMKRINPWLERRDSVRRQHREDGEWWLRSCLRLEGRDVGTVYLVMNGSTLLFDLYGQSRRDGSCLSLQWTAHFSVCLMPALLFMTLLGKCTAQKLREMVPCRGPILSRVPIPNSKSIMQPHFVLLPRGHEQFRRSTSHPIHFLSITLLH